MEEEWQPISEERIWDKINDDWLRMGFDQRRLWEAVKVMPEKWSNQQKHYHHGSWVVAIIGSWVVWYDDIEEDFTRSRWRQYRVISDDRYGYDGDLLLQLQNIWMLFAAPDIGTPFRPAN